MRKIHQRPALLLSGAVFALVVLVVSLAFFASDISHFVRTSMLGQVILSVTVINPDVPEILPATPAAQSSGGSGSSGGDSGASSAAPAKAPTAIASANTTKSNSPIVALASVVSDVQQKVTDLLAAPATPDLALAPSLSPVTLPVGAIPVSVTPASFPRKLTSGTSGQDVQSLQRFLNTHGSSVSTSGKGSLGQEGTKFGPKTQAALLLFQRAHAKEILGTGSASQFTGTLGPKTTAYIIKLLQSEQQAALDIKATTLNSGGGSFLQKFFNFF